MANANFRCEECGATRTYGDREPVYIRPVFIQCDICRKVTKHNFTHVGYKSGVDYMKSTFEER